MINVLTIGFIAILSPQLGHLVLVPVLQAAGKQFHVSEQQQNQRDLTQIDSGIACTKVTGK
jgi:hypothetical protein